MRGAGVAFGNSVALFVEASWFLARRDDAVVVSLLQGGATPPRAVMADEEGYGNFQTRH